MKVKTTGKLAAKGSRTKEAGRTEGAAAGKETLARERSGSQV